VRLLPWLLTKISKFLNPKDKSMKRNIILTVMLLAVLGAAYAQEPISKEEDKPSSFVPEAGDFSAAILFGRGNFLNSGLTVPSAPGGNTFWNVSGQAPFNNTIDANLNSVNNIVGAEMRYFLMSNIALKLSGGAIIRNTPDRGNLPSVIDPNGPNAVWIPAYNAVMADNQVDINLNLGGEYHFATKYNRLSPYAGLTIPFYYGRRSEYDPTINDALDPSAPGYIVDVGVRHAELVGFGVQGVAGVDYYLMEGFYFGFEIKPVSYVYAYTSKIPAPGLDPLKADNHSWSFFSQTFLKIGFRF